MIDFDDLELEDFAIIGGIAGAIEEEEEDERRRRRLERETYDLENVEDPN